MAIDRVANLTQHQFLLNEFMKVQKRMADTQEQISTGKVGDQFKDISEDAGVLLAAKRAEARTQGYMDAATELASRLQLQDVQITTLADHANDLRQGVTEALANNKGLAFMERVDGIFRMAVNILNARVDGRYVYGGTRTDVPPVNVETLKDLAAAPTVASVFDNSQTKTSMQIDDGETMEFGVLASDLGTQLFTSIRNIAQFNAGPNGPFGDDLTAAQRSFLEGELQNIITAADGLNLEAAKNGVHQNEVSDALERHDASKVVLKSMISDIEDVDMAEAITRLNQTQVAAQATAKMLAELNQLTLLNFLP